MNTLDRQWPVWHAHHMAGEDRIGRMVPAAVTGVRSARGGDGRVPLSVRPLVCLGAVVDFGYRFSMTGWWTAGDHAFAARPLPRGKGQMRWRSIVLS